MTNKAILVSVIALFAIAFSLVAVSASTCSVDNNGFVTINKVLVDHDINLDCYTVAEVVGSEVQVQVIFTANDNVDNARVKVYTEGFNSDVSETSPMIRLVDGKTYEETFTLQLPSSDDLTKDPQGITLNVRVYAEGKTAVEKGYDISMQKNSYSLDVLSVDAQTDSVVAGNMAALDVVVQNNGHQDLNNVYVTASIPELGISKRVYYGDIVSQDKKNGNSDDSNHDAVDNKIYLSIPNNAIPGTYDVEVKAYNYDTETTTKTSLTIQGLEAGLISSTAAKTVAIGGETEFDLVLVNPNDKMVVYTLTPGESTGLTIDIAQPIVAVPAGSSTTVQVKVTATDSATQGTHVIPVNVNSINGSVRQVSFTANVEPASATGIKTTNTVFVLTVVLAIVFVVLLIILIVLLTKKPAETEEFGETSYY